MSSVPLSYKNCLGNLLLILLMNMFGLMRRRRAMPANRLLHLHKQLELAFSNRHKILFVLGDCPWFTENLCCENTFRDTLIMFSQFFHCKIWRILFLAKGQLSFFFLNSYVKVGSEILVSMYGVSPTPFSVLEVRARPATITKLRKKARRHLHAQTRLNNCLNSPTGSSL